MDGVLKFAMKLAKLIPEKELSYSLEGMLSYESSDEVDLFIIECNTSPIEIKYSSKHYYMEDYNNPDMYDEDEEDGENEVQEFIFADEIEVVRKKET